MKRPLLLFCHRFSHVADNGPEACITVTVKCLDPKVNLFAAGFVQLFTAVVREPLRQIRSCDILAMAV